MCLSTSPNIKSIYVQTGFVGLTTPRPLNIIKQNNGEQIIRRRTRKRLNPDSLSSENPAPKQQRITNEERMNGEESDRSCASIKNQQPSPCSRSPRSTQAFLANQTLEIHRRMPPLLLPSHPPSSLVVEGNGGIAEGGITSKVEGDWLRFWTKYKMAATSGVPGSISNLSSPENDAPLDLAIRQRDTSAANVHMSTNGPERRRQESPLAERLRENWKGEKEEEERTDEGGNQREEIGKEEKDHLTKCRSSVSSNRSMVEVATQDDLTNRCIHCGIYFLDEVMYALHMSCHGDQGPYQCSFCLHVCADRYDFTTHIQRGLHRYTDKALQQKGHTQGGKIQSASMMSERESRSATPEEKKDGVDCNEITCESDDVTGVCHGGQADEITGNDANDNEAGAEKEVRVESHDITDQELGGKMGSESSADITKTIEVTTVAESENLDENTEKN
ncbi:zinc finger transcription factor Trps1 isoform X1 [Lates japonicus]|uniref:Zinc finger transcription factor Trps1 isoform X1 n=1 Tax=Lates japonicus TaxID=270547 RepID=A0AAD3NB20_LATJO|nr:zinc finger transcription factor Trps1 isoform X1 [Lates japonicus]